MIITWLKPEVVLFFKLEEFIAEATLSNGVASLVLQQLLRYGWLCSAASILDYSVLK